MPKWGNKLTTVILPDGRIYKAYVSSDGKMRFKDKDVELEVDNRGADLGGDLIKAATYGFAGSLPAAAAK